MAVAVSAWEAALAARARGQGRAGTGQASGGLPDAIIVSLQDVMGVVPAHTPHPQPPDVGYSDRSAPDVDARRVAQRIVDNVERVIIGKRAQVEMAVMTLMSGGHLLLEDVPGVGKTVLARSLARSSGCLFSRIQFTPDLLPTDVTGVSIYNQKTGDFQFRPGPILSQVILADE